MATEKKHTDARIGIVLPYFGKLPNYFPIFLESCRWNPTIDWLLYTDSDEAMPYPDNVKIFKMTYDQFREMLQKPFDFQISLEKPYKVCDYRPAFGEIFHDDLVGYDFWGHCDCDMIFGNIRKFISKEVTDTYDRILNCGALILYRNTPEVNAYYRTQTHQDYKAILQSPPNHTFDEWRGMSAYWHRDGKDNFDDLCFDDIRPGAEDFRPVMTIPGGLVGPYHDQPNEVGRFIKMQNILYSFQEGTLERCWLQNGQVQREETLYLHLQKRKMQIEEGLLEQDFRNFLVVPNTFRSPAALTPDALKQLAPKSRSSTTRKNTIATAAQVIWYEIKHLGKPDYRSRSAIVNLLNPKKNK